MLGPLPESLLCSDWLSRDMAERRSGHSVWVFSLSTYQVQHTLPTILHCTNQKLYHVPYKWQNISVDICYRAGLSGHLSHQITFSFRAKRQMELTGFSLSLRVAVPPLARCVTVSHILCSEEHPARPVSWINDDTIGIWESTVSNCLVLYNIYSNPQNGDRLWK